VPEQPIDPATVRPDVPELADVDGVGAVTAGTIAWAVALVLCLAFRTPLADAGRTWWTWVCLAGLLLGLAGLVFVRRRRAAYRAAGR
jgi:LPXTG-motif cell wall-anchored protein